MIDATMDSILTSPARTNSFKTYSTVKLPVCIKLFIRRSFLQQKHLKSEARQNILVANIDQHLNI